MKNEYLVDGEREVGQVKKEIIDYLEKIEDAKEKFKNDMQDLTKDYKLKYESKEITNSSFFRIVE